MADLSSIVAETRSELGQFFSKPKLSDKLLSKPPFRFLHDIVSALTAACGFAEGVFVGDELNSKAMNASKDTKAAYLKKLIGYVTDMSGEPVQASIKSIMAGKEPELTNAMLQQMAKVCRGLAQGAASRGGASAAAAAPAPAAAAPTSASDGKEAEPAPEPARERPHHPPAPAPAPRSSDDGGGGKMAEPADAAAGGSGDAFQPPSAFGADGSVGRTQEILQPLISKPKLSDKLLGRPPLRFLHDVLSAVQDATGWGAGLLPPELASSSSVKVKENKAVFLDLFINAVALDLRTFIPASPTNIMAGKECADTNVLLQLLGIAAQRGNGAAAVAAVHAGERQATSYPGAGTPQPQAAPAPAPAPAPTPAPAPAPAPAPTEWGGKTDEGGTGEPAGSFAGAFAGGSEALAPEVAPDTGAPTGPRSIRPSTARRRPLR